MWDLEEFPEELTLLKEDVERAKVYYRKKAPEVLDE